MLDLIEFTDPYCTWCWGSEPIIRRIQVLYGNQVSVSYVMGGLVADLDQFYDPTNRIGGANWRQQVADHWLDASRRHGMPVDERVFFDLKDEFHSTHPACIAYKAAQFQNEELANKFLRRMREGAAAERKHIHRLETQLELAEEVGLDPNRFIENIENDLAKKAFMQDLTECRARGITGFPTFLIRNDKGRESTLFGYHGFDDFVSIFENLEDDTLTPNPIKPSDQIILDFVRKYGRVAPREVAEVFSLLTESAMKRLDQLKEKGLLQEQKVGNGFFYRELLNNVIF